MDHVARNYKVRQISRREYLNIVVVKQDGMKRIEKYLIKLIY